MWQCAGVAVDEHDMISVGGEQNFTRLVHNSATSAISECLSGFRFTYYAAQNTQHLGQL